MHALGGWVAVGSTLVCLAATPARGTEDNRPAARDSDVIRFTAKVLQPPLPSGADSRRSAWRIGVDPRWLVVVRVEEVVVGKAPFEAGTEQRFLIHSPAIAFCGVTPRVGRRYTWDAKVSKGIDGRVRFLNLTTCFERDGKRDSTKEPQAEEYAACAECTGFAENPLWPVKGGNAIVGDGVFVGVDTDRNEVFFEGQRSSEGWTGKAADQPEVVIVYERRVLDLAGLPSAFDLSKALVISFEADRVRFFDFRKTYGGYYKRLKYRLNDPW